MIYRSIFVGAASVALLAGCGSNQEFASNNASETPIAVSTQSAADTGPPKPDCSSLPISDGKTDNDILNIDVGMSADDAIKIAKCSKEGYEVSVTESRMIDMPDGSHPRGEIVMQKKYDKVSVFLIGLPGQEKVVGLARVRAFVGGEEPALEQMRADLLTKYGPLIPTWGKSDDPNELSQAFSPSGQLLPKNEINSEQCDSTFGQNGGLGQIREACGFTKKISILTTGNPGLVGRFEVYIGDQNRAILAAKQMGEAIRGLQAGAQDAARQKAASSNRTPNL